MVKKYLEDDQPYINPLKANQNKMFSSITLKRLEKAKGGSCLIQDNATKGRKVNWHNLYVWQSLRRGSLYRYVAEPCYTLGHL